METNVRKGDGVCLSGRDGGGNAALCFGGRGCFAGGNQVFTDCLFGHGARSDDINIEGLFT